MEALGQAAGCKSRVQDFLNTIFYGASCSVLTARRGILCSKEAKRGRVIKEIRKYEEAKFNYLNKQENSQFSCF